MAENQNRSPTLDYSHYRFLDIPIPGHQGEDSADILDLSYMELNEKRLQRKFDERTEHSDPSHRCHHKIQTLYLQHNNLRAIPPNISRFRILKLLDLSNNSVPEIPENLTSLKNLRYLIMRNNQLDNNSLPKSFGALNNLETLNLSGNNFTHIPHQVYELNSLKALYLGGNQIEHISKNIAELKNLEMLYLGGNLLTELPTEMGLLRNLQALVLCENKLQSLPATISCLKRLRSLALHKNNLTTLPPALVKLSCLVELSLRDNPLVVRFVKEMTNDPPSLLELSARSMKVHKIKYSPQDVPPTLKCYLETAQRCVNPKCKGVYFDSRVEHIKFVDFCGKYRLPLLEYLCSPNCKDVPAIAFSDNDSSDEDSEGHINKLRRVLLG